MLVIQSTALAAHNNMKVAKKRKKIKATRAEKCLKTHVSTSNFSQISIDNENINSLRKCQRFMRSLLWNIRLHSTSFVPAINQGLLNQDSSHRCCLQAAWKISSVSLLSSSSIHLTRKEKKSVKVLKELSGCIYFLIIVWCSWQITLFLNLGEYPFPYRFQYISI